MNDDRFIRFFNCSIPVTGCNLRCDYCYLIQRGDESILDFKESSDGFDYPVEHMLKALSPERMGGICAFHICGDGETLLWSDLCQFAYGLFEMGHFVSFTSNCTYSKMIDNIVQFPREYREKMFFKCSFHYSEFKRLKLLDRFASNVNKLARAGISYSVEIVTNDYVLENIDEIIGFSIKNFGAKPHVLTQRSEYIQGKYHRMKSVMDQNEYDQTWGQFESPLFEYQQEEFERKPTEFCYAGVYSLQLHLKSGDLFPCPGNGRKITNLFSDISKKPIFAPVGHNCPLDNCWFGFVTHVMGGVDRDRIPNVFFRDFRDRVRADNGTHWLSETMQRAYGCRCSDFFEPLSVEKQIYMDNLMSVGYKGAVHDLKEMELLYKYICEGKLTLNKSYAIYGMGPIGRWLKELIEKTGGHVLYGLDRQYDKIESNIPIYSADIHNILPDVDEIVVSVYSEYNTISAMLEKITKAHIVSVLEFI